MSISYLLEQGYNPFDNYEYFKNLRVCQYNIIEALDYAFSNKKSEWKKTTLVDNESRLNLIKKWIEEKGLNETNIIYLRKNHISTFLNEIAKKRSLKTVNNYHIFLSSLFSKLAEDEIIENNFILNIKKRKTSPIKNKPLTTSDLKKVKEYLKKNDLLLYFFIQVMVYTFLRNREVLSLKIKDIDIENNKIFIPTKTERRSYILIIEKLKEIFQNMNIEKYKKSDYLISLNNEPGQWKTELSNKVNYMGKRFNTLKKKLNLDEEYTLYSLRHTFILDLFNSFINRGLTEQEAIIKMLPITRHKSESGLRNYLRGVGGLLPDDYSELYNIDF